VVSDKKEVDLSEFCESETDETIGEASGDEGSSEGVDFSSVVDIPAMIVQGVEVGGALAFGDLAKMTDKEAEGLKVLVPAVLDELGLGGDGKVTAWGALALWSVAYAAPRFMVVQAMKKDDVGESGQTALEGGVDAGDISKNAD
jgi:hypothetical protein